MAHNENNNDNSNLVSNSGSKHEDEDEDEENHFEKKLRMRSKWPSRPHPIQKNVSGTKNFQALHNDDTNRIVNQVAKQRGTKEN